jgi:hypothetical protein
MSFAIPNPKSWETYAKNSKIKKVAKVIKVETERKSGNLAFLKVSFESDNKIYTGKCVKERKTFFRKYKTLVGGIYFNPKKNDLVYVTINKDGGEITTYQPISQEEAIKYKQNPSKIRYDLGKAYIED